MKARDRDPARSLRACLELGAEDKGTLTQRDTDFEVPRGRLKLREEPDAAATLIAYERPGPRRQQGARIHLDRVEDLGDFIEFEGVAVDGDDPARFTDLLASLRGSLAIRDDDLLRESYADLLPGAFGEKTPAFAEKRPPS